jgi:hypothetical protein
MTRLDVLHKGIYSGIAIAVTLSGVLFAIYVYEMWDKASKQVEKELIDPWYP